MSAKVLRKSTAHHGMATKVNYLEGPEAQHAVLGSCLIDAELGM
jgi:hypothetical protein